MTKNIRERFDKFMVQFPLSKLEEKDIWIFIEQVEKEAEEKGYNEGYRAGAMERI